MLFNFYAFWFESGLVNIHNLPQWNLHPGCLSKNYQDLPTGGGHSSTVTL